MISKTAARSLIEWKPVCSRIITARFYTRILKVTVIQCNAPTNDADQKTKDSSFKEDMILMTGDFNAKVGKNNTDSESAMGKHGLGSRNENGEQFAEFCAFNSLVIGGTLFPYKKVHKATWVSPDHVTENQIDDICISQRFRRSMLIAGCKSEGGSRCCNRGPPSYWKTEAQTQEIQFPQMQKERITDTMSHYFRTKP